MKKTLLSLIALSALALAACAPSHTASAPVTPVAVAAVPAPAAVAPPPAEVAATPPAEVAEAPEAVEPTTFQGDGFEVSVPASGWHQLRTPNTSIVGLLNPEMKNLTLVVTEDTKLSTAAQRDYVAKELLKNSPHAKLVAGSKKSVKSNGITFASFRITSGSHSPMRGWIWVTVQKGKSVALLCSGAEDDQKSQEKACDAIFKSLKLTNGQ